MWDMAKNSITLFFQGRLFKDSSKVYRQILLGAVFTGIVMILATAVLSAIGLAGEAVWIAAAIAGFLGGMLQPYLFKDLKYA